MKHAKRARTEYLWHRWVYSFMHPRPYYLVNGGRGGGKTWSTKTVVDILADVNAMIEAYAARPYPVLPPPIEVWGMSNMEMLLRKYPQYFFKGV
jgi:hypothetical protein